MAILKRDSFWTHNNIQNIAKRILVVINIKRIWPLEGKNVQRELQQMTDASNTTAI